jgi:hypothetical protein
MPADSGAGPPKAGRGRSTRSMEAIHARQVLVAERRIGNAEVRGATPRVGTNSLDTPRQHGNPLVREECGVQFTGRAPIDPAKQR